MKFLVNPMKPDSMALPSCPTNCPSFCDAYCYEACRSNCPIQNMA